MNSPSIRTKIRQQRRNLDLHERQQAAAWISSEILRSPLFMKAKHIAIYLSNDGEIDLSSVLHTAWQRNKRCYLPVLNKYGKKLSFAPYTANSIMRKNRFGIPEPIVTKREIISPHQLDLVLAPLVAFDEQGNRMGMGGGFYDRSFSFLRQQQHWQHTKLIGTAYAFQQVEQLPAQAWDVPLSGAFTEYGYQAF
ncbi:MAG: 5-formyltetrahydrofolate cyclo-ligase [Sulfuriflexus sp.]|nr:5-formyltetrahydrofolate cyclo-ligase [Sulfuriflexus sp.]